MKKFLALLLTVVTLSGCVAYAFAESETVTLAELKTQAPERLQMTVTTDSGNTIAVDAPIILPEGDALPVLLCRSQRFIFGETDQHPLFLNVEKESAQNLLYGRTDTTGRYPLSMGEKPPENDFTLEQAVELIMHYNAELGGNPDVDLRPHQVAAMSGLCKMKSTKVTVETTGVSFRMPLADPKQPVKGNEKGLWCIKLSQYLHGIRVIDDSSRRYRSDEYWCATPTINQNYMMDEENFKVLLSYLGQEETLREDSPLANWDAVENSIRTLIEQDKLKSVYQVELVYLVKTLPAVIEKWKRAGLTHDDIYNMTYVLVPVWEIKGWNLYKANAKYFASGTSPDRETILMNGVGERHTPEDYVLRLNADTATPFEPTDMVYGGELTGE